MASKDKKDNLPQNDAVLQKLAGKSPDNSQTSSTDPGNTRNLLNKWNMLNNRILGVVLQYCDGKTCCNATISCKGWRIEGNLKDRVWQRLYDSTFEASSKTLPEIAIHGEKTPWETCFGRRFATERNFASGKCRVLSWALDGTFTSVVLAEDKWLVCGMAAAKGLRVFDVSTRALITKHEVEGSIYYMTSHGTRLFVWPYQSGHRMKIHEYVLPDLKLVHTYDVTEHDASAVVTNGKLLLAASTSGELALVDLTTKQKARETVKPSEAQLYTLMPLWEKDIVYAGGDRKDVMGVRISTGEKLWQLKCGGAVLDLLHNPLTNELLIAEDRDFLRIIDLNKPVPKESKTNTLLPTPTSTAHAALSKLFLRGDLLIGSYWNAAKVHFISKGGHGRTIDTLQLTRNTFRMAMSPLKLYIIHSDKGISELDFTPFEDKKDKRDEGEQIDVEQVEVPGWTFTEGLTELSMKTSMTRTATRRAEPKAEKRAAKIDKNAW